MTNHPNRRRSDRPLVRTLLGCPVCGQPKTNRKLMCWPCFNAGGREGEYDIILDDLELKLEEAMECHD